MKDVRKREGKSEAMEMTSDEQEKNCLFIYQIPLKVDLNSLFDYDCESDEDCEESNSKSKRGIDDAVLKKGERHSEFKGTRNKKLERDLQFPIRCTVQFYKVTDVDITETLIESMGKRIDEVFSWGVEEGSLVEDDSNRKTEWIKEKDGDDIENEVNKKEKDELENTTPTEK